MARHFQPRRDALQVPRQHVIGDFGCGDARLALELKDGFGIGSSGRIPFGAMGTLGNGGKTIGQLRKNGALTSGKRLHNWKITIFYGENSQFLLGHVQCYVTNYQRVSTVPYKLPITWEAVFGVNTWSFPTK